MGRTIHEVRQPLPGFGVQHLFSLSFTVVENYSPDVGSFLIIELLFGVLGAFQLKFELQIFQRMTHTHTHMRKWCAHVVGVF